MTLLEVAVASAMLLLMGTVAVTTTKAAATALKAGREATQATRDIYAVLDTIEELLVSASASTLEYDPSRPQDVTPTWWSYASLETNGIPVEIDGPPSHHLLFRAQVGGTSEQPIFDPPVEKLAALLTLYPEKTPGIYRLALFRDLQTYVLRTSVAALSFKRLQGRLEITLSLVVDIANDGTFKTETATRSVLLRVN